MSLSKITSIKSTISSSSSSSRVRAKAYIVKTLLAFFRL